MAVKKELCCTHKYAVSHTHSCAARSYIAKKKKKGKEGKEKVRIGQ